MGRLKLLGEREVSGGAVAILEGDASIVAQATAVSFAPADFLVEDAGNGRANVALDYANGAMALADKSRPSPWVGASDLAPRSIADLGTRDHHLLTGLDDDDHPQYGRKAADEDISGLWRFSNVGQLDIAGTVKIAKTLGVGTDPIATALLKASATLSGGGSGISLYPNITGAGSGYGVQGYLYDQSTLANHYAAGLDFVAAPMSTTAVCAEATAVRGRVIVQSTQNVTTGYGFRGQIYNYGYGGIIGTAYGLYFQVVGSGCTDATGLKVLDVTGATGSNYLAEFGSGSVNLRVISGTPPAGKSNVIMNFGGTLYRLIKVGGYVGLEAV